MNITMGNIGEEPEEWEIIPLTEPAETPVEVPSTPAREPVPA